MVNKQEKIGDGFYNRYKKFMPRSKDVTLIILKGHLLIEENVSYFLDQCFMTPEIVRDARLTFYQKIKILQAIIGDSNSDIWKSVLILNSLRNNLAHNLEIPKLNQNINELLMTIFGDYNLSISEKQMAMSLKRGIAYLCGIVIGMCEGYLTCRRVTSPDGKKL